MNSTQRWDPDDERLRTQQAVESRPRAASRIGRDQIVWARACRLKGKDALVALTRSASLSVQVEGLSLSGGHIAYIAETAASAQEASCSVTMWGRPLVLDFAAAEDAVATAQAVVRAKAQIAAQTITPAEARDSRQPLAANQRELSQVAYLGGTDSNLIRGQLYDLRLSSTSIEVYGQLDHAPRLQLLVSGLREAQLSGRGAWQKGGGFFGGGFGAVGAAEGVLITSALNAITTKRGVEAILRLSHSEGEFWFLSTTTTPEAARLQLAPLFHALGRTPRTEASTGLVERLHQLVELHGEGVLTDEEFAKAKSRLLDNDGA